MKKSINLNKCINIAKFIIDLFLIPIILIVAYSIKFKVGWIFQNILNLPYGQIYHHAQIEPYLKISWLITLLWITTFYFSDMYKHYKGFLAQIDELLAIIKGMTIGTVLVIGISFVFNTFPNSKYVIFYTWLFGILFIFLSRLILHQIEIYLLKKNIGTENIIVIGANAEGQDVAEKTILMPRLGYKYCGTLDKEQPNKIHYHLQKTFNLIGPPEDYQKTCKMHHIKHIFVTTPNLPTSFTEPLIRYCKENEIELNILSNLSTFMSSTTSIHSFDGLPFIQFEDSSQYDSQLLIKRLFDTCLAMGLLILFSPLFVLSAILIKLSSKGPILYKQERVGRNGTRFNMIKFRTMHINAEKESGPVNIDQQKESAFIKPGRFLRKMSLDELPQLINVIRGEMSIVGPRPERPHFVEKYQNQYPFFNLRHKALGGITGWAQINGRSILTNRPDHKLKYDLYYIKNWSLILDIKILLKTIFIVLRQEEAY